MLHVNFVFLPVRYFVHKLTAPFIFAVFLWFIATSDHTMAVPSGHPMNKFGKKIVVNVNDWLEEEGPNEFKIYKCSIAR